VEHTQEVLARTRKAIETTRALLQDIQQKFILLVQTRVTTLNRPKHRG
jgi:hypothetical protein